MGDWSMSITLSRCSRPSIRVVRARPARASPQIALRQRRVEDLRHQRATCPEPDTPVTATNRPSGKRDVDVLQVVLARAPRRSATRRFPLRRRFGTGDRLRRRAGTAGDRAGGCSISSSQRARSAISSPPCSPAPGPMSIIQSADADRLLVVLDHDQRVAQVAQPHERRDQPGVVALVQADATARPGCRARPSGSSRSASPAGCAAPRRPRACRSPGRGSGSRARRRPGSRAARGSP